MTSTTTLTREALLERAKPRYEEVPVDDWGTIGLRSVSEVQKSRRSAACFDMKGNEVQKNITLRRVHEIVDQVMVDVDTPMFKECDVPMLAELDATKLEPLFAAIRKFNGVELDLGKLEELSD